MATTVTATTNIEHNENRIEGISMSNNNDDISASIKLPVDVALNAAEPLERLEQPGTQAVSFEEASKTLDINIVSNSMATADDAEDPTLARADDDDDEQQAGSDAEQTADDTDEDVLTAYNARTGTNGAAAGATNDSFSSWQENDTNMFNDYIMDDANGGPTLERFPTHAEDDNLSYYSGTGGHAGNVEQQQQHMRLSESVGLCPSSPASVCYSDDSIPELKYTPNEYLMQQPPSSTALHFNYPHLQQQQTNLRPPPPHTPYHAIAQQQQQGMQHAHSSQQPPHHQHHGYAQRYHNLPHGPPVTHALHGRVPHLQYAHHPAGYYPNMWYPNAPYGSSARFHNQYASHGGYPHSHPHHPAHPHYAGYPHDPMLEMLQLSNSGREARNRAEKNRRDKLNGSIQELSTMVPHVAESPKRVDKTAVLRFAAHGLRLNYIFGNTINQDRPQVTDALMSLLDSFLLTLTCHGQIVLISNSIEQHLGHCQADLYGQNILQITHPEDHALLKQHLIPADLENLFDVHADNDNGDPRPRTQAEEDYIDKCLREDKRSFTVRLARAGPRSEPTTYEIVKIDGCFRRSDAAPRGIKSNTFISSLQLIRRSRGRDDTIPLHTISGNDIVLVAIARIIGPPKIVHRPIESKCLEYKTRHLIDGRIVDCDQRISIVAGYMRDEVQNLSPFTFIHQDDVRWVIVALRQMYDCNSSYGESTYRLYTRNRNFIYLQTKGYLEIDKDTNKVHSFVCINTLLDEAEGKRCVQEMKNKFSVFIKTKIPQSSIDAPAAEHPQQLEKAVMCLIQNLQKSPSDDDEEQSSTSFTYDSHGSSTSNTGALHMTRQSSRLTTNRGSSKTPPLALVPPEPSTIKSTISKSLSIVNVTPAQPAHKIDRQVLQATAHSDAALGGACGQHGDVEPCLRTCSSAADSIENNLKRRTVSEHETVLSDDNADDAEMLYAKRRLKSSDIETDLTSSLNEINRTLNRPWNTANELRDCGNKFQNPHENESIEEILEEEQQEHSEIYLNIKSEYEVQRQNMTSTTKNETDPQINAKELRPS